jgi:hypothetical protein
MSAISVPVIMRTWLVRAGEVQRSPPLPTRTYLSHLDDLEFSLDCWETVMSGGLRFQFMGLLWTEKQASHSSKVD